MATGNLSAEALRYLEEKRVSVVLEEAMHDLLQQMPEDPLAFLEAAFASRTPLRLMVTGPPKSGKTTQCTLLAKRYGLQIICPDDLTPRDTHYTTVAKKSSDEAITDAVLREVRAAEKAHKGWVLDNFPQTRAQAIHLQGAGVCPKRVFCIDVPADVTMDRCEDSASATGRVKYYAARKDEIVDCYRPFFVLVDGTQPKEEVEAEMVEQVAALEQDLTVGDTRS